MASGRKTNTELADENHRLRAQVAQLEDKLDHLSEHGTAAVALHHIEALHRDVMSVVSDVVMMANEAGRLAYVSPNAHLIFGHCAADILKQGRISYVLPSELFDPDLLDQRGEIANINCQIRDSVGRARNLLLTVRRLHGRQNEILYVCRDVTERIKIELDHNLLALTVNKRVEDETRDLRESRDRYRRLVEGLREEYMFYASDMSGVIMYASPSVHNILGYTPDQVVGHNWREFVDVTNPEFANMDELDSMRIAGISTPRYTRPIPHANGEIRVMEFRDTTVFDQEGKVIAIEGIGKDVTQRNAAEEALRRAHEQLEQRVRERTAEISAKNEQLEQTQERYFSVISDQLEFIVRWRGCGVRTFVNDSYCNHCNSSCDDLIGVSFLSAIVEEDREELQAKLATLSVDCPVIVHEHRTIMPDGRTVWERWTHRALFNSHGELMEYQSVGCDVTEQRKREEHVLERQQASVKLQALTDREYDVMRLVVAGDANKVAARKLGLSIKTIEKHRSSLMRKLKVRSVPELVRFALLIGSGST